MSPHFLATVAALVLALAASASPASAQAVFNTDVPAGKWRALRVRAVPEGAVLAVQIALKGTIGVALVRAPEAAKALELSRALFRAPVENRLSFSVTAPAPGDYYVVLDNRRGADARAVEVKVQARRAPTRPATPVKPKKGTEPEA